MAAIPSALGLVFVLSLREAMSSWSYNSSSSILLLLDIFWPDGKSLGLGIFYSHKTSISSRHCDLMSLESKLV